MAKNNEAVEGLGLLVLRLAVGGMMLTHGLPKLQRLLEKPDQFPDPIASANTTVIVMANNTKCHSTNCSRMYCSKNK